MFSFIKKGDLYIFDRRDKIYFYGERFILTFTFINFHQENYDNLLQKFNTYTAEEEEELRNTHGYGKERADIFTLRFHLENRKAMEELGFKVPFYINQEIIPF